MKSLFFICLFLWTICLFCQSSNSIIKGKVVDETNGYPISYARVTWDTLIEGVYTESDGSFLLEQPKEITTKNLYVLSLGYNRFTIKGNFIQIGSSINIKLEPASLDPILVQSSRVMARGVLTPSINRLLSTPVVLGQADIIKSLTIYPGIAGGREGLTSLHVRGGSDDQNLYLIDGTPIYNPGHIFGFLSVFNPNMVSRVNIYKDFIPTKFARRLSSVIDIETRDGSTGTRLRSKEIGLLGFGYTDEGPTRDSSLTYAVGFRTAHTLALTLGTLPSYLAKKDSPLLFSGMYDINLKVSKLFDRNNKLTTSVYLGDDLFGGTVRQGEDSEASSEGSALLRYGNRSLSFLYSSSMSHNSFNKTRLNISAYNSGYRLREVALQNDSIQESFYTNKSTLRDFGLSHQRSYETKGRMVNVGGEINHLRIEPSRVLIGGGGVERILPRRQENTTELALFSDISFDVSPTLNFRIGIRVAGLYLNNTNTTLPALGYNAAVDQKWGKGYISASYRQTSQLIHSINLASGGLPIKVWIPITEELPIEIDRTVALSYYRIGRENQTQFSASLFYRRFSEQVILPDRSLSTAGNNDWITNVVGGGKGRSYGFELYHENVLSESLLASLSYTYSRSFREFTAFNKGNEFVYDFDRPHDLYLSFTSKINKKWSIISAFAIASGLPYSQSTANALDFVGDIKPIVQVYNNARFPVYHRLDILLTRNLKNKKNKDSLLKFGVYNVYGRRNPLFQSYGLSGSGGFSSSDFIYKDDFRFGTLFNFFPMLSYEVKY